MDAVAEIGRNPVRKADSNGSEKLKPKWPKFVLTRLVQIRIEKSAKAYRNKITNEIGHQFRLHERYKTANGFRARHNYY